MQERRLDLQSWGRHRPSAIPLSPPQVAMAQGLNARLSARPHAVGDPDERGIVRYSMVELGLSSPAVTADAAGSEYHRQLASELASVLTRTRPGSAPILSDEAGRNGVVGLDEAW